MQTKTRLTLPEIYRIALVRGMTAKQAGAEFGVNYSSVSKMKARLKLPSLISEYEYAKRKSFKSLTNQELERYIKLLEKTNNTQHEEYTFAKEEASSRVVEKAD